MINTKKKNNSIVDKVVSTTTIKVNVVFARGTLSKQVTVMKLTSNMEFHKA